MKSNDQWRRELPPDTYRVMRQAGTEPPFSGAYCHNKAAGTYDCAACGSPLFSSTAKYESGTGWPSFYEALAQGRIATSSDPSLGMLRTEVHCANCGGHLGHLFDDGPPPTGKRYCINSLALKFKPEK